jgi:hypothetical protein
MNPRFAAFFKLLGVLLLVVVLFFIFPSTIKFVEMAARELRYLWWLVLLVALAVWMIIIAGKKPRQ